MSATKTRQPVVFVGHGSPMNAIEDNQWSRGMVALGKRLAKPKAILAVSAHWYVPGVCTTGNAEPPTIHDFGGFPRELYQQSYPAAGDPGLAHRVAQSLGQGPAAVRDDWGLDHGTWSVLCHLFPQADVPVVQLSIDLRLAGPAHVELGKKLAPLRDEGVLLFCSGNLTHNLRAAFGAMHSGDLRTPAWAASFDGDVAKAVEQRDLAMLGKALERPDGPPSHPSPDHYLPVLYAAGAALPGDKVEFPITGFDMGSLSMRSVVWGA
jgi:4,5-DOPA dioxygenase extradiol